jgi:hypothetical protein
MVGLNMGLLNQDQWTALGLLGQGISNRNFSGGATAGMAYLDQAPERQMRQSLLQAQVAETQAQAQERAIRAKREQDAMEQAARLRQAIPGLFQAPGMAGGAPQPQTEGGIPMFSRPMGAAPMQATPGGFDVQRALQLGMPAEMIEKYAGLQNLNRPEVARTVEVDDGRGGKATRQFDKFGQPVGDSLPSYIAPVPVQQGDKVTFARPTHGAQFPVNMSPGERDASARGWAGVNQGAQRLQLDAQNANASKAPPGYRFTADGRGMEAIPGGPADLKAGAEGQKRVGDARDVIGLLDEVDKLLPKATGSYAGAGVDQTMRFFGKATDGANATAQLKTLQGALIGKMPKMTGPQSDKDVQLYREMAGQVADHTLPVETRQAASAAIRRLNEKYAGMQEGDSTRANLVAELPKTAAKGARARDTTTGKIMTFNGMSWVPEK